MKTTSFQLNQRVEGKVGQIIDVELISSAHAWYFKPQKLWIHGTCDGAMIGPPQIGGRKQRWGTAGGDDGNSWWSATTLFLASHRSDVAIGFDIRGPGEAFIVPVKFEKDCTVDISAIGWGAFMEVLGRRRW